MKAAAFLEAVRASVATKRLPDPGPDPRPRIEPPPLDDVESDFRAAAVAAGASVHSATDEAEARALVARLVEEAGARNFLSWDGAEIPVPGLLESLESAGFARMDSDVPGEPEGRRERQLGYFDCAVGITGADAGLAATGSLVLGSGPGRPRMASLIPTVHIALLRPGDIRPSLRDWLAEKPTDAADVANLTVITGPSRTADIEMVITHGVHGPRHLQIVLVPAH